MTRRYFSVLPWLAFPAHRLFPQTSPSSPPITKADADALSDFRISSDVELVLLDVSVKDKDGGFASGLVKEQFTVLEDNKPVEVKVFTSQDVPVTVGLVVDGSGSTRPKRAEIVTAALSFSQASNPLDEMFLVHFNDSVKLGLPDGTDFTDNRPLLRDMLLKLPAEGRTALYDAVILGLQHLQKGKRDKKTLVLISDGGDNSSAANMDDVLAMARETLATIYTIGIFTPDDKEKNPGVLKKLAALTGGECFLTQGKEELVPICKKIANDIRARYTIGYAPPMGTQDGKPHKIRVLAKTSDNRKLEVRTRTEYVYASKK